MEISKYSINDMDNELIIDKTKIYNIIGSNVRKTKIICTLGYEIKILSHHF
jgi:hypothetical protein